tara:strand:- start:47 stop:577 length:531 start_codon:yes stop_codon:yes gene_type:complete
MKKIIFMFLLTSLAIGQSSTLYFTDGKTLEGEIVNQSKDGIIFKVADPNKVIYPLGSIQTMVDKQTFVFKDKFIMKIDDSSGIQIYPDFTGKQVGIITRDGKGYIGEIVSENEQEIVLKTPSDITLTIAKNKIIERNEFSGKVEEDKVVLASIGCTMVFGFLVLNIWESILDGLRG